MKNSSKKEFVNLMMHASRESLEKVLRFLPKTKQPTIRKIAGQNLYNVLTFCQRKQARDLIPELKKFGCADIVEFPLVGFTP